MTKLNHLNCNITRKNCDKTKVKKQKPQQENLNTSLKCFKNKFIYKP